MTEANKTRQKLMDSMRKAKNAETGQTPVTTESKSKSRASTAPARAKTKKLPKKQLDRPVDAYSSGRRVWPD